MKVCLWLTVSPCGVVDDGDLCTNGGRHGVDGEWETVRREQRTDVQNGTSEMRRGSEDAAKADERNRGWDSKSAG